jgi:hypothetical protein
MPWVVECAKQPKAEHEPSCSYRHSHPTEGDEGATCSCGVYGDNELLWLDRERRAFAWDKIDALRYAWDTYHVDLTAEGEGMVTTEEGRELRIKSATYVDLCEEMSVDPASYMEGTYGTADIIFEYNTLFAKKQ